ncbi:hypothetical protein BY996DRAFT_4573043 [Phakopsora pachyrhizi]|nr:hypothetical protein BY996DRAFT_4573043 [Phakopsora pachyrhizi]
MQSRRKEKESLTGLSGSQGQSQSSTASPPAIPTSPVSNPTPLREHRNRRSLSQPPPIPRVVRSATDRLRHHRPSNNLPNGAIQSNSSPTNQAPGFQAMASPSQPLSAVGASHNNATAADVTIMQGMNSISADEARNSDESQSNQTLYSLRLVPHLDASRSLHFEPIERKIPCSTSLKIGRFTDRGLTPGQTHLNCRIAFKSKVVSRGHADIFTDTSGNFFIKDTKSSSGTFLNHIRLSAPGGESRPFPLRDGDILQLGVDYQGGTEEIYRCVKMRVELNRGWQRSANAFNQQALSQLRSLGVQGSTATSAGSNQNKDGISDGKVEPPKAVSDCCICLFGVTVCQALFIAPCSHTYHYKCIRPLLQMHHPGFSCPLCRTFADLEADVETEEAAPKSPVVPALGTSCILEDLSPVPEASGDTPLPNGMDASEEANFISRGVEVNICGVERSETLLPNFLAPLSVPGTVSALTGNKFTPFSLWCSAPGPLLTKLLINNLRITN